MTLESAAAVLPVMLEAAGAARRRPAGPVPAANAGRLRGALMIDTHRLRDGSSLLLPARPGAAGGDALTVVLGGGRGCVLRAEGALAAIWIPLRGNLQCNGGGVDGALACGALRVSEAAPAGLHVVGRGNALWLAVLGRREAWRSALSGFAGPAPAEPLLLPAIHPADRELRRSALRLARMVGEGRVDFAVEALLDRVVALETRLAAAVARCPGRTYAQRRQVFVRLQRVRNYLVENSHLDIDGATLARMASFSPWHFIRAFRAAYEETPHAFLVEQRLRRARRLLASSTLAISEIALAIGFENRSAFSRLFRQRFGVTARAMRRECAAVRGGAVR